MQAESPNEVAQGNESQSAEGRVIALAVLIIAALALQPAFAPRQLERQSEFAWEMYAKGAPRDEFLVDYGERIERITVTDVQERALATVDYTEILPRFLCDRDGAIVEVTSLRADQPIGVLRCAP